MLTIKWIVPAVLAIGLVSVGQPSFGGPQSAEAKTQTRIDARRAPDTMPARELETYGEDIRLTNQCIDSGSSKGDCLCVVQVLKYEMSMGDYRRVAQSWTVPARYRTSDSKPPKVSTPVTTPTTLIAQSDFAPRCAAARRYFGQTLSR